MSQSNQGQPELLYSIEDIPPRGETIALGFQHYLTMFGSTVAIPLILAPAFGIDTNTPHGALDLGMLIATMFFVSGITTLLQSTWGNRLPIIQGGTFSFLAPTFAICSMAHVAQTGDWQVRMVHVQGAIILGGAVEALMGMTGLAGKVLRFVGPITIAPTIALIGLALFKFGAPVAGLDWWMGGLTIFLIILFSQILRHKARAFELYPILLALLAAWGVAALCSFMGVFPEGHASHVSLKNVEAAPWVNIPSPFQWGTPEFGMAAFLGMFAGFIASMVESIGDYFACARLSGAPTPNQKVINRGITFEGIGCMIAGVFGTGNGTTSYSENVGAIGLTRVGSRRVVQTGALIMLLLGGVGKFGALFTTIPQPIVGGMYCALFGMIAAVGLSNLQLVNLNSSRNLFILGFAFFMGLSVPEYVERNPITIGSTAVDEKVELEKRKDTDTVTEDSNALHLLGLGPNATVLQAKAAHQALSKVYAREAGHWGRDPGHAGVLDQALFQLTTVPPKDEPVAMLAIPDDYRVSSETNVATALGTLGIKPTATVKEAKELHLALKTLAEQNPDTMGPGFISRLDEALNTVSQRPEVQAQKANKWKWLEDILNTLGKTGMAVAAILAMLLDNLVPGTREERGMVAWADDSD